MKLFLTIAVLLVAFFICIVNMIYRKIECKNYSEWKKNNAFNSPTAWALYALCIAIITGGIFIVSFTNIMSGLSNVGKQQDSITQQQKDASTQLQEDTSTQQQDNSTQK